ncbi:hypothetical protein [Saccharopolyspora erythraea]|uniref:hypothetical protein n=1 Tax=Saccharopolyspora erythraea TaxID=1836 RepID=UPI003D804C61
MKPLGNVLITGGASGRATATARAVADEGGTPLVLDIADPGIDAPHVRADLADRPDPGLLRLTTDEVIEAAAVQLDRCAAVSGGGAP